MENKAFSIIKNGTQTSRITLPLIGTYRTFLLLQKQRFFCRNCLCSFVAQISRLFYSIEYLHQRHLTKSLKKRRFASSANLL
ncbi:transposase family protein [Kurthia sibirica]|uniref:transposase family protein n=1 Tax=Kurthia sibirica TaxID=202750 RepID=UPI00201332D4|nr:transposase family protein [Kurthia sibirica]